MSKFPRECPAATLPLTGNEVTIIDDGSNNVKCVAVKDLRGPNVQIFTGNGTWVKPAGVTMVQIFMIGGGGGGGGGRRSASGVAASGGAGASPGVIVHALCPASFLGATEAVAFTGTGAGAAPVTTDDTNGAVGSNGITAQFSLWQAKGGNGGNGGNTSTASAGAGAGNHNINGFLVASIVGGAGTTGQSTTPVTGGPNVPNIPTSAAGGSGLGTTDVAFAGPAASTWGTAAGNGGIVTAGAAGGTIGGGNGSNGVSLPSFIGTGGGGGSSSFNSAAGNGGNGGGFGGAGAGGGASRNGFQAGGGGNGAPAIVVVTCW